MADAYIGQIELFAFDRVPQGWQACVGQLLSIQQNQTLFSLLGTTYGGNGVNNFAVPDLRGRCMVGVGPGYAPGQTGGAESVALSVAEWPLSAHSHNLTADPRGTTVVAPASNLVPGTTSGVDSTGAPFTVNLYSQQTPSGALAAQTIGVTGGQAHENRMPYLALNYCICVSGNYPG